TSRRRKRARCWSTCGSRRRKRGKSASTIAVTTASTMGAARAANPRTHDRRVRAMARTFPRPFVLGLAAGAAVAVFAYACRTTGPQGALDGDVASRVYVAPGEHDEFYSFMSGGFSGQVTVYGLPSGRLLKVVPVFSQHAEDGWGYSEETKPMLVHGFGCVRWDDGHQGQLSIENGGADVGWVFISVSKTLRIAWIWCETF